MGPDPSLLRVSSTCGLVTRAGTGEGVAGEGGEEGRPSPLLNPSCKCFQPGKI